MTSLMTGHSFCFTSGDLRTLGKRLRYWFQVRFAPPAHRQSATPPLDPLCPPRSAPSTHLSTRFALHAPLHPRAQSGDKQNLPLPRVAGKFSANMHCVERALFAQHEAERHFLERSRTQTAREAGRFYAKARQSSHASPEHHSERSSDLGAKNPIEKLCGNQAAALYEADQRQSEVLYHVRYDSGESRKYSAARALELLRAENPSERARLSPTPVRLTQSKLSF